MPPLSILSLLCQLVIASPYPSADVFSECKQLVVVTSPSANGKNAKLWKFERSGGKWKAVGPAHPVNLGKKGLAWGRGIHSEKPGVQKQEGDLKSPAGIFRFGDAFGYAAAPLVPLKLDYRPITESDICVEDSKSQYYNQIVDGAKLNADWTARESMLRSDYQYKWGIVVKQNSPPEPESGSCIFFHLWRKKGSGTLGCTAMAEDNMLALMKWLDPGKKPLLMQMTNKDYEGYRRKVGLPSLR
ncbi:MAG: hypothetical protein JNN28_05495 [Saprospiraceae bacterium]|nr:hypothetical protein [Saprospiraceae bacterium]